MQSRLVVDIEKYGYRDSGIFFMFNLLNWNSSWHHFQTSPQLCAGTNTLGRFINHNMLHSSTEEAHRLSCNNYGSGEVIKERHQFLHVELEAFWLDKVELLASFYSEFFTEG